MLQRFSCISFLFKSLCFDITLSKFQESSWGNVKKTLLAEYMFCITLKDYFGYAQLNSS